MPYQVEIKSIKDRYTPSILAKPNVVGVGTGYKRQKGQATDQLCIVAMVRTKMPKSALAPEALVPKQVDGVPTDVMQVGELHAYASPTDRYRPAPGGVSIGHYKVTAGTLGVVVRDQADGSRLILSNNHVLANSNDAQPGDPILQPGVADNGKEGPDTIAHLERFCALQFADQPATCGVAQAVVSVANALARLLGSKHRLYARRNDPLGINLVDAALARPVDPAMISDEILEIGRISGSVPAALGASVRKSGRTTGLTTGQIVVLDATLTVNYGERTAKYQGQMVSTPMSSPGDSGSLLVDGATPRAVGLLFAGSDQATIFNPIAAVLDCLGVTL
jgi:hypothetical protein